MTTKTERTVPWTDLDAWEHLLVPGVKVRWQGATSKVFDTILVRGTHNARLRFEDGHECEPCYIEHFVGIETDDEVVTLTRWNDP